jgi:hypothetical protein
MSIAGPQSDFHDYQGHERVRTWSWGPRDSEPRMTVLATSTSNLTYPSRPSEQEQLSRYSDRLRVGRPGFDSWQRQQIFLSSTVSRPVLGSNQLLIQWVPGSIFPALKWPGRETDHSPSNSVKVKYGGAIPPLPISFYGVVLDELSTGTHLPMSTNHCYVSG